MMTQLGIRKLRPGPSGNESDPNAAKTRAICERIIALTDKEGQMAIGGSYAQVLFVVCSLLIAATSYLIFGVRALHEGRFAFRFEGASRPLFRAGIEDYVLEPSGAGTRFTYVVALEPSLPVRMLGPVTRRMLGKTFRDGAAGLQAFVAAG